MDKKAGKWEYINLNIEPISDSYCYAVCPCPKPLNWVWRAKKVDLVLGKTNTFVCPNCHTKIGYVRMI